MSDHEWLLALAAWNLGDDPIPQYPVGLSVILRTVEEHKLVGVIAAAVGRGDLQATEAERSLVADAHRRAMGESLLLEEMLLLATDVLRDAGIEYRVLKGTALAHGVYSDPSERSFGDNDLLVWSRQINEAVELLIAAGATRPQPRLTATFDRRFAKSVTLDWLHNTEIDLHRTLAPGPFGLLIHTEDLFSPASNFEIAGRSLPTLSTELHLVHAAIHVSLGDVDARLGNLRDIALLCNTPGLDVSAVTNIAAKWKCEAPLAAGLSAAAMLPVPLGPLGEWSAKYRVSSSDASLMATYAMADGRFRRQAIASIRVLPRWRDRVAYAAAVVRNPLRRAAGSRYARRL